MIDANQTAAATSPKETAPKPSWDRPFNLFELSVMIRKKENEQKEDDVTNAE